MKYLYSLILAFVLCINAGFAQMSDGNFGDEWINFDQSYFKIPIAEDGIYRISQGTLAAAGIPVSQIATGNYQLYRLGEQVPIFVSAAGLLGANDYIEFYGKKNRSELDRHLFADPDNEMLNPDYSLITDTMSYFLTWVSGTGNNSLRFNPVNNDLSNPPPSEAFFWYDERQVFTSTHIKKRETTDGTSYSNYNETEGFGSSFELVTEYTIQPVNPVITGPSSIFRTRFASNLPAQINHTIAITLNNEAPLYEESFNGVALKKVTAPVTNSLLTGDIAVKFTGTAGPNDRHSVGNISLTYPRSFNFDGATSFAFSIEASTTKKLLDIENFSDAMGNPVLYDLTNGIRIEAIVESGRTRIVLPPSSTDRDLILFEENSAFNAITTLNETTFIDYSEDPATYLIISNSRLYNDAQGINQLGEYATYRSSAVGGGFRTRIVEIEDLYNQYAYGIHRHPLSIKNFVQKVKTEWEDLAYLLIIGKGREYHNVRTPAQVAGAQSTLFVPTFGYPGSDNLLVSENGKRYPTVATGRIAATSAEDIAIYLKKVRDLEAVQQNSNQTIEERGWMKQILHLGGGGNGGERDVIRRHLEDMEEIIENNIFGAEVTSVFKRSNDAVQNSRSEKIFERINEGVSMITFFGHSGVGTFDFNIDNPDNYENFEKYPLMFSLGCYSGNIHTAARGISERFVYYEDRGAIGFGATTGLGYISGLNPFMSRFYELAGGTLYGQGMGDILRSTVETYNNANTITLGPLAQQFTLQGDPAIKLNPSEGTDYVIEFNSVSFEPSVITSDLDSFDIRFSLLNLGRGLNDSINLTIEQTIPSGDRSIIATKRILAPMNSKDLEITLASKKKEGIGLNRIFITVDTDNEVAELPSPSAELNNTLVSATGEEGVFLFIVSDDARPIFPEDFSIVNTPTVTLVSSTSNPISLQKNYLLELDTTEFFNSPVKEQKVINQKGGLIKWTPTTSFVDGRTYYWRVSPDSINPLSSFIWNSSSFTYLSNESEGWNQSHYYQYEKDVFTDMEIFESNQKIDFLNEFRETRIRNKVPEPENSPGILQEGTEVGKIFPWSIDNGIAVIVRDPVGLSWKENPPGGLYGSTHNSQLGRFFLFKTDNELDRKNLIDFLNDQVENGEYVFVFTVLRSLTADLNIDEWEADTNTLGTNIFDVLEEQGATQVRQLLVNGSVPYGLIYQKNRGLLSEAIANTIEDEINPIYNLSRNKVSGSFLSTDIGPASSWSSLKWLTSTSDSATDTVGIKLYGLDENGLNPTLLAEDITEDVYSLNDISTIQYPYLRLEYHAFDSENRTTNQIEHWRVAYQGLPDVAINSNERFIFYNDTINKGEDISMAIAIENVSKYDMDSLLIKHSLIDEQNNSIVIQKRVSPLASEELFIEEVIFEKNTLAGNLTYIMELNPNEDQPELYHFNNILIKQLFVTEDQSNPLLDVTFDGVHIMNGDIVSAKPQIEVRLVDENKYLALADTSLIQVAITYPDGNTKLISYSDQSIEFIPAEADELQEINEAILRITPDFLVDGTYQLTVNGEDVSANSSGEYAYSISFEVINKPGISNVLNYPNPFSTSTQFIYTLTGNKSPSFYKIQIFTVSGKVIREITQDEIGPLRVGTHKTDYRWDGTDEFGGRLANGVYLYRMITKDEEGNEYENTDIQKTNSIRKYFKNDFGKMVILR